MENESFFNKKNIANAVLTALVVTGVVFVVSFLWMSNTQLHELKVLNTQILGELGEIKTELKELSSEQETLKIGQEALKIGQEALKIGQEELKIEQEELKFEQEKLKSEILQIKSESASNNSSLNELIGKVDGLSGVIFENSDMLNDVQSKLIELEKFKTDVVNIDGKLDEVEKNNQYLSGQLDTILSTKQ